ncbi:hypothetical protein VPHK225_0043 [Vibrio phage K225]|nr:hypothetical protein PODOV044v1_p0039 [Vibrio phage 23E28.1]QZI92051.1 hypothetical protein PODOV045v1_p0009 [Vibrio phage 69E27.1]
MSKFKEGMKLIDVLVTMADGNIGAATVVTKVVETSTAEEAAVTLSCLDKVECYGSDIWVLYKDKCGENIEAFKAEARELAWVAFQKGN